MSAPRLLVIQPDETDPLGPLGDWLSEAGAELDVRLPPQDSLPDGLDGYQGLVCLGGAMNAEEDSRHPWLAQVRRLLNRAAVDSFPTLAVCLGAQMLAVATGGRVERGSDGPEVGPSLVAKKDVAWTDPLFADLPLMQDVWQFHTDVIEQLPSGADLLASAPRYPHQAFRLNRCVYGIQFHIETTPEVVRNWADGAPETAAYGRERDFEDDRLAEVHADIAETWRPFAHRFVRLAAGELEPASDKRRTLPLA
ncbi:type 1 glutamine amidotransferase [Prauserella cavernicola]|uniref:Type 1 glutamine amidotransferase n=1 Tax=Prauserella cavernicola TaxID=2800127 RepID=A0A934V9F1_9PSEU|nr:type 1 glutamine amidotransferase [Prauserella cavernicola]MBK1789280.1 type 1 glutamine amidotransferase [Prauserella cavernicola]